MDRLTHPVPTAAFDISITCFLCIVLLSTLLLSTLDAGEELGRAAGPIYDSSELDYQPAIIRIEPDNRLMVVFERIELSNFFGDFQVSFSSDNGATWSAPQAIIASPLNERHPALVQLDAGHFALFYLVDETGNGAYRIHRATSPDGLQWTDHGILDLGWGTPGEINPSVIDEGGGVLSMTYHRLSGPSYFAQSQDDGATWDTLKTEVSNGQGSLPRLVKRTSDGRYLVTYQVGGSDLDMFSKSTYDPYNWPATQTPFSTAINSHDSQPIVLEGGTFLVTYAQQVASVFDLHYRTSYDGETWSDAVRITQDTQHYDTQPHPMLSGVPGQVFLVWSHQESSSAYVDHDVWFNATLAIPLPLQPDSDRLSVTQGGTVQFDLDAGTGHAQRRYFLLGSMSGTLPGTALPGGGVLPLNRDAVTQYVLGHYNSALLADFRGRLDGGGQAQAVLNAPSSLPLAVGTLLNFAYTTEVPYDFQSNPVEVLVTP